MRSIFSLLLLCASLLVGNVELASAQNFAAVQKQIRSVKSRITKLETNLSQLISSSKGRSAAKSSPRTTDLVSTTWTGTLFTTSSAGIAERSITVVFSPADLSTGTFTSTPYSLSNPAQAFDAQPIAGTWRGSYRIVENLMFFFSLENPSGAEFSSGSAVAQVSDQRITLFSNSSLPAPLIALSKSSEQTSEARTR